MHLPSIYNAVLTNKKILVRIDCDVPIEHDEVVDDYRLRVVLPTIQFLLDQNACLVLLGHRGRSKHAAPVQSSLRPIARILSSLLNKDIPVVDRIDSVNGSGISLVMLENLRWWEGEEKNDPNFVRQLARLGEIYVNEAFADSHRSHASITGLPSVLPHFAGIRLQEEVEHLIQVFNTDKKPIVVVLGGGKADKAAYIEPLLNKADWVLVGGLLPRVVSSYCRDYDGKSCVVAGHLTPSGEDIDQASITNFSAIISQAEIIVWNGPMGKYEEEEFIHGTKSIVETIAKSSAYKVIGGGDTIAALKKLGFLGTIDWVSTGGGAMLQFLAEGDLSGLAVLRH